MSSQKGTWLEEYKSVFLAVLSFIHSWFKELSWIDCGRNKLDLSDKNSNRLEQSYERSMYTESII